MSNETQTIRKEELDVSKIFLAYASCGGDIAETASIAGCQLADVIYLSRVELWDEKLKGSGLAVGRTKEEAKKRMKEINRMACYIQAVRLRGLVDMTLKQIYEDESNITKFCQERDKRGNPFFSTKPLTDLVKASEGIHAMMYRSLGDTTDGDKESGNPFHALKNLHMTVVEALNIAPKGVEPALREAETAEGTDLPKKSIGFLDIPAANVLDQ